MVDNSNIRIVIDNAGVPLSGDERAELIRLRQQVAQLSGRRPRTGRWVGYWVLLPVAALLAVASVTTGFVRSELLDTNRYVDTVAPLIEEPAVRAAVADLLAREIVTALDLSTRVQQLADEAEELGAPELLDTLVAPAVGGIQSFLRTELQTIMSTQEFAQLWDTINRLAHDELADLLTTGEGQFLTAEGNQIYLNLGAVVSMARERLIAAGFTLAQEIPADLSIRFAVFHSDQLPELQTAAYLLNLGRWLLPVLTLVALAAAVALAPDHRRGLLLAGVAVALAMLLALAMLALARNYYLDNLPAEISRDAAAAFFDTLLRFYADTLRTLAVLAAIVALACWLVGPGRLPTAGRRIGGRGLTAAAAALARTGVGGPVPNFVHRHRLAVEVAAVTLAVAGLVLWRQPGVAGTLWIAGALAAVLLAVELVARMPQPARSSL
jgi:hypothetical protein